MPARAECRRSSVMNSVWAFIVVGVAGLSFASGVAKILLVDADVQFFGQFGFGAGHLTAFGLVQLVGGVLMIPSGVRRAGAAIVRLTFLVSAVLLAMDGKIPVAIVTLFALVLCVLIIRRAR